jgi:phage recombination protein Bet
MATGTTERPVPANIEKPKPGENLPALRGPRLPFHPIMEQRFGIDRTSWKALCEAIFPNATTIESIALALSYCKARKLDPFKRVVHIVPIWNKQLGCMIDTVWPGIGELRTTAFRTGEYAGRSKTVFGPLITKKIGKKELTFPEYAQVTVKRMIHGQIVEFSGPDVFWEETYATQSRNDETPNEMWSTRPRGQIDKCAEAAALRAAFPEECGGDYIPEEVQNARAIDTKFEKQVTSLDDLTERLEGPSPPMPEQTSDPGDKDADESEVAGETHPIQGETTSGGELPSPFAGVPEKLDAATDLTQVNNIQGDVVEKFSLNAEEGVRLQEMCDAARERIRASRGSKSNK